MFNNVRAFVRSLFPSRRKVCGPLSDAEAKRFKKILRCPDCGSDEIYGASGSGTISRNIYCKNCSAMFDVSPFQISRIKVGRES